MGELLWICFMVFWYVYIPHIFLSYLTHVWKLTQQNLLFSLQYILSVSKNRKQDKNFQVKLHLQIFKMYKSGSGSSIFLNT